MSLVSNLIRDVIIHGSLMILRLISRYLDKNIYIVSQIFLSESNIASNMWFIMFFHESQQLIKREVVVITCYAMIS
jgi:hypothetical protein